MRITVLLSFLLSASEAFVMTSQSPLPRRAAFFALKSRADATSAIENAQQATAKYGADSPEARLAWEAVEEIDGSDNSVAFQKSAIDECSTEQTSDACLDYEQKLMELTKLLEEQRPRVMSIRNIAEEIRRIRMADPSSMSSATASGADPAADSPAYNAKLTEMRSKAEATSKEFGADSAEARLAWTEYEELASTGAQTMGDRLDEMCLVETQAMEACEALEELSRVLNLSKDKSRYSG